MPEIICGKRNYVKWYNFNGNQKEKNLWFWHLFDRTGDNKRLARDIFSLFLWEKIESGSIGDEINEIGTSC